MVVRKLKIAVPLFTLVLAACAVSAAESSQPCVRLKRRTAIIHDAFEQINSPEARRGTAESKRITASADKAASAARWPFEHTGEGGFTFQAADFDGDGRTDKITEECGSGETRVCFLWFDKQGGKRHELQAGFMYITRIDRRFYVAWDYVPSRARILAGGPENPFSEYYAITSHGFVPVCGTKRK
jgi:hypothetical protein